MFAPLWARARPAVVPVAPLALKSHQQKGSVKIETQEIVFRKQQWMRLPAVFYYRAPFVCVSVGDGPAPLHFLPPQSFFQTRWAELGAPLVSSWGSQLPLSWVFRSWKSKIHHQNQDANQDSTFLQYFRFSAHRHWYWVLYEAITHYRITWITNQKNTNLTKL